MVELVDGKVPMVWWTMAKNFGDLLSPWLVRKMTGKDVFHVKKQNIVNYVTIGSILGYVRPNSIVWGTGSFGTERQKKIAAKAKYLAVRGPLTRNKVIRAGGECPRVYGDPALLVREFHNPDVKKEHEIGVILRWSEFEWEKTFEIEGVKKIYLKSDQIEETLNDIISCKRILSSSLHGLIIADTYGIPNAWLDSNTPKGLEFKYWDYLCSVGKPKEPISVDLMRKDLTLKNLLEEIEYDGREMTLDFKPLIQANPFGWKP